MCATLPQKKHSELADQKSLRGKKENRYYQRSAGKITRGRGSQCHPTVKRHLGPVDVTKTDTTGEADPIQEEKQSSALGAKGQLLAQGYTKVSSFLGKNEADSSVA